MLWSCIAVPPGLLSSRFPAAPSLCPCCGVAEHWWSSSPSRATPLLWKGNLLAYLPFFFPLTPYWGGLSDPRTSVCHLCPSGHCIFETYCKNQIFQKLFWRCISIDRFMVL